MSLTMPRQALSPLPRGALALALLAGCGGASPPPAPVAKVTQPAPSAAPAEASATTAPREEPPPSGPAKAVHAPKIVWSDLTSGLKVGVVPSPTAPLAQVRVVVLGGAAADGERPGAAVLTGEMLAAGGAGALSGRDLAAKIESLGARLTIETGLDSTVLALSTPREHLAEALDLLATMVGRPQWSARELDGAKKRAVERAQRLARSSPAWAASMVLYRDLFSLPADVHPYAAYDALPAEIAKLSAADCRALHRRMFVPKNTLVMVTGDVPPDAVKAAVDKAFTGYRGGEPAVISFTDPMAPESLKITLVDMPKSAESAIYVGALGPEREDASFAAFTALNQVLGGGASGRLQRDLHDRRGLAVSAGSSVVELAHGPSLIIAHAEAKAAKTGLALQALLEHLERAGKTAPDDEEIEAARRALAGGLALRLETTAAVADLVARQKTLDLPDDALEGYAKALAEVTAPLALKSGSEALRPGHQIVVVAGDAQAIGGMLSHFGDVKVLDPAKGFERSRTLRANDAAPLEPAREASP